MGLLDKFGWFLGHKQKKPSWSTEEDAGVRAVPNPDLKARSEQRRSQVLIGILLMSLPLSVGSCGLAAIALLSSGGDGTAAPLVREWEPGQASAASAVAAVWEHMANEGYTPERVVHVKADQAGIPCGFFDPVLRTQPEFGCDQHQIAVWLPDGEQIGLSVLIDPTTSQPAVAPSLVPFPLDPVWGEGPVWSRWYPPGGELPDDILTALEEWATAWSVGNQRELLRVAGSDEGGERPILGLDGWEYVPGSISAAEHVASGPASWQVSATLEIRKIVVGEDGEDCATQEEADRAMRLETPEPAVCAPGLKIAVDLAVVRSESITLVDSPRRLGGIR